VWCSASRLRAEVAVALALFALFASRAAQADEKLLTRASSEIAGYTDSVGVSVFTPSVSASIEKPTAGWGLSGRYLLDVVSAASPDIVATASPRWSEVRHAGNLGARYKPGAFGISFGGAVSSTPDYLALGGSAQLTEDLDDKNLTLTEGYSFGSDTSGRTGTPFSVFSHHITTHAASLGLSRVVNPGLVLGAGFDGAHESGDQSKPYRYVPVFAPDVAATLPRGTSAIAVADSPMIARPIEQLPQDRSRGALTGRMSWRTEQTTLRLEERLYADSWSMLATTTDVRYFVDASDRVTVWPHLRVHAQSGVDFWERAYSASSIHALPTLRTGDRELGPLSTFGLGGGLRLALGRPGYTDALVLSFTADGFWTSFSDALYVKERFAGLGATTVEVAF
jgi:hypothetical protein